MNRIVHIRFAQLGSLLLALLIGVSAAQAQTTSFTYQGRFTDNQNGGNATNGTYDFQFRLFDALNGGNQIGGAVDRNGVTVTNSAFTVQLDFGAAAFPGANRFLEISARPAGGGSLSTLTPRQPVTSTPYAIKSLSAAAADTATTATNAQQLGGQAASQFVLTGDARLSDARTPTAGSGNYIQNTTAQQANSNFFISQVGTAGQDLNAGREITVDFGGTFNGNFNSFGGLRFGNTGFQTGEGLASKRTSGGNQFGLDFYTGYVSRLAITNNGNVGVGTSAPGAKLEVNGNMLFSNGANRVLGVATNPTNANGHSLTVTGGDAQQSGAFAVGGGHLFLTGGKGYGIDFPNAGGNVFVFPGVGTGLAGVPGNVILGHDSTAAKGNVGIGTNAPNAHLQVGGFENGDDYLMVASAGGNQFRTGLKLRHFNTNYGWTIESDERLLYGGTSALLFRNHFDNAAGDIKVAFLLDGKVGIGTTAPADKLQVTGDIRVGTGTTGCVKDADGTVITGTCSSDLRFKKDVTPFANMLDKVARLQPVYFNWRASEFPNKQFGNALSFGLIAQEVEQVLPELVTKDEQGFRAVNYSKLPLLTLQAVKELKAENETLKQQNAALESRLEALEQMLQQLTGQQVKQTSAKQQ